MKRSPLKRKKALLKRTPLNKISTKGNIINKCRTLFFKILLYERKRKCEICGSTYNLGTFHILPTGTYPKLRFRFENVLLVCWWNCHNPWHSSPTKKKFIEKKIALIKGANYEQELKELDAKLPKEVAFDFNFIYKWLKGKLK